MTSKGLQHARIADIQSDDRTGWTVHICQRANGQINEFRITVSQIKLRLDKKTGVDWKLGEVESPTIWLKFEDAGDEDHHLPFAPNGDDKACKALGIEASLIVGGKRQIKYLTNLKANGEAEARRLLAMKRGAAAEDSSGVKDGAIPATVKKAKAKAAPNHAARSRSSSPIPLSTMEIRRTPVQDLSTLTLSQQEELFAASSVEEAEAEAPKAANNHIMQFSMSDLDLEESDLEAEAPASKPVKEKVADVKVTSDREQQPKASASKSGKVPDANRRAKGQTRNTVGQGHVSKAYTPNPRKLAYVRLDDVQASIATLWPLSIQWHDDGALKEVMVKISTMQLRLPKDTAKAWRLHEHGDEKVSIYLKFEDAGSSSHSEQYALTAGPRDPASALAILASSILDGKLMQVWLHSSGSGGLRDARYLLGMRRGVTLEDVSTEAEASGHTPSFGAAEQSGVKRKLPTVLTEGKTFGFLRHQDVDVAAVVKAQQGLLRRTETVQERCSRRSDCSKERRSLHYSPRYVGET